MYRILLVEDDTEFRASLVQVLRTAYPDAAIMEAGTGREALAAMAVGGTDLVLMDIGLPDIGGLQLTREIHANHPGTRVIVLTGHNLPEYRQAAEEAGASAYVWKGESSTVLLELVQASV